MKIGVIRNDHNFDIQADFGKAMANTSYVITGIRKGYCVISKEEAHTNR